MGDKKVLVLKAERFNYWSEKKGRQIQGGRVWYTDLKPVHRKTDSNQVDGVEVVEARADFGAFLDFGDVPGFYEFDWRQESFQGAITPIISAVLPVSGVEFAQSDGKRSAVGATK